MEKTPARPRWGLVRTYAARALGSGGLESARASFQFEPDRFRNLYKIAHSERRWKSGTRSGFPAITSPHTFHSSFGSLAMLTAMRHASYSGFRVRWHSRCYTGGRLCPHTCWRPAFRKRKYFRTNSPSRAASGPPQTRHAISPSMVSGPASALTT